MADESPTERLLREVFQKETGRRLQVGADLLAFFEDGKSVREFEQPDKLVEGLASWMNSSNPKICSNGLELLTVIMDRMGNQFKPYVDTVLPALRERLGDQRQPVREACLKLAIKLMVVSSPQAILDKLLPQALAHKGWHVREEGLVLVVKALNRFGTQHLLLGRHMTSIAKLTADANFQVRDQAMITLAEMYRHIGERIRVDVAKKGVPPSRLNALYAKFDEVRDSGKMIAVVTSRALPPESQSNGSSNEETSDGAAVGTSRLSLQPQSMAGRAHDSAPGQARRSFPVATSHSSSASSSGQAGAVNDDDFWQAFTCDVPTVSITSTREVEEELSNIEEVLSNSSLNWGTRVAALKKLRGYVNAGVTDLDIFSPHLHTLGVPLASSVKDLRSQVARECCITISLLACKLGVRCDHLVEALLPPLFQLLPNSAKVMASSAHVCISFIIQYIHSPRLVPLFGAQVNNKSAIVRRRIVEYFNQILHSWSSASLERHVGLLEEAVRKGINDADSSARSSARRAFWGFADHFPVPAERLRQSLDPARQRHLADEQAVMTGQATSVRQPMKKSRLHRRFTSEPDLSPQEQRSNGGHGVHPARHTFSDVKADLTKNFLAAASSGGSLFVVPLTTASASETTSNSTTTTASGRHSVGMAAPAAGKSAQLQAPRASIGMPQRSANAGVAGQATSGRPSSAGSLRPSLPAVNTTSLSLSADASSSEMEALRNLIEHKDKPADAGHFADDISSPGSDSSYSSSGMSSQSSSSIERLILIQDVPEILHLCSSGSSGDRRQGLASLQELLRGKRILTTVEVKNFTQIFYRMFNDPHNSVLATFLDVVKLFAQHYHEQLSDWLPVLLQRLLFKAGSDLRQGTILRKVLAALQAVRESFSTNEQFRVLMLRILPDASSANSSKSKLVAVQYLEELVPLMDPSDVVNTPEMCQSVAILMSKARDPSSPDMRQSAGHVAVLLFRLNTAAFTTMIAALPRHLRESATSFLQDNLEHGGEGPTLSVPSQLSPRSSTDRLGSNLSRMSKAMSASSPDLRDLRRFPCDSPLSSPRKQDTLPRSGRRTPSDPHGSATGRTTPSQIPVPSYRRLSESGHDFSASWLAESVTSSNFARTGERKGKPRASLDEQMLPSSRHADGARRSSLGQTAEVDKLYNPAVYRDDAESQSAQDSSPVGLLNVALDSKCSVADRHSALKKLGGMTVSDDVALWGSFFSPLLLKLLPLCQDSSEGQVQFAAFRLLGQLMRFQARHFVADDVVGCMKVITECFDSSNPGTLGEVISAMSTSLPAKLIVPACLPHVQSESVDHLVCGLKILAEVLSPASKDYLVTAMDELVPVLIKCYSHSESNVRKCSVFCLVELHTAVGEELLMPRLSSLTTAQAKLLKLYIRRQAKADE